MCLPAAACLEHALAEAPDMLCLYGASPLGDVDVEDLVLLCMRLCVMPSDSLACAGRLAKGGRPGEADSDLEDEFDDLRIGGKRKRAAAGAAPGTSLSTSENGALSCFSPLVSSGSHSPGLPAQPCAFCCAAQMWCGRQSLLGLVSNALRLRLPFMLPEAHQDS